MKTVFVLLALVFAFSAQAQNLNRVQKIEIDGQTVMVGFINKDSQSAFYGTVNESVETYVKITTDLKKDLHVEILRDDTLLSFNLNARYSGKIVAEKSQVDLQTRLTTTNNTQYWRAYKVLKKTGTANIILYSALIGLRSIDERIQVTGKLSFNPCDGCEHGDQFMLKNINVITAKNIGDYYIGDCEGEVLPLFFQLFDENLAVPFTYRGLISMDVTDYFDAVGDMWMADSNGELFVGSTTNLPVSQFLDSLITRTAQILKVDQRSIHDDVVKNGKFEYKNNVLTFTYKTVVIKTNL